MYLRLSLVVLVEFEDLRSWCGEVRFSRSWTFGLMFVHDARLTLFYLVLSWLTIMLIKLQGLGLFIRSTGLINQPFHGSGNTELGDNSSESSPD